MRLLDFFIFLQYIILYFVPVFREAFRDGILILIANFNYEICVFSTILNETDKAMLYMVLILDGKSEIDAHVQNEIW